MRQSVKWPLVLGEDITLHLVTRGMSLSRFGDGEFNLCLGYPCAFQRPDNEIRKALRHILMNPGDCLIGIPRQNAGPKKDFWRKFDRPDVKALFADHHYAAACVTRPDSAPWIDRADYWETIKSLWKDQDVTLVRGSVKSLTADMLTDARSVDEVIAPECDAFAKYDELMERVGSAKKVILCLGPTATVMAYELQRKGAHAIDLGHIGLFLRKYERGQSMELTEEDRRRA